MMSDEKPLRYQETGNIHLDFHGAANTTIDFIVERYGVDALHEIFQRVGRDVYADIRRHLMDGDASELVRHWQYFFDREGADYEIVVNDEEISMIVRRCPAYMHVKKIAPKLSERFCDQTIVTNAAMAEGTAFTVTTDVTGEGSCRQTIRRRK